MKYVALAILAVVSFPVVAMAGDHSRFSFFLGLGGTDIAISNHHVAISVGVPVRVCDAPCAPVYVPPAVYYQAPVYCQPPVVVYSPPPFCNYPVYDRFNYYHEYRPFVHAEYAPVYSHYRH
jgi:hypothetical protein